MKVAPSTSALPAGNSVRARWSGRMPYLIGPNSAPMTPKPEQARQKEQKPNCSAEAGDRDSSDGDLGKLEALGDERLVVAVGHLAAEAGQKEIRRDENRAGERDQRLAVRPAELKQDEEDERGS